MGDIDCDQHVGMTFVTIPECQTSMCTDSDSLLSKPPTSMCTDSDSLLSKPPTRDVTFDMVETTCSKEKHSEIKCGDDDENIIYGVIIHTMLNIRAGTATFFAKSIGPGRIIFKVLLFATFFVYLGFAFSYKFGDSDSIVLLVVSCIILFSWVYRQLRRRFEQRIFNCCVRRGLRRLLGNSVCIRRSFYLFICGLTIVYIVADVMIPRPRHMVSASGMFIFVFLTFFFSKNPAKVRWRTVIWGLFLQFVVALLILRTPWGFSAFEWMSDRMVELISFANAGSEFVFGPSYKEHFLAFQVLPVVVFFSSGITILHYLGLMQFMTDRLAVVMNYTIGTSVMESLHSALNIFIGWRYSFECGTIRFLYLFWLFSVPAIDPQLFHQRQWYVLSCLWGESMMFLRGKLEQMTVSEIHTIMTSSFAIISGSNLAAYVMYGAPTKHLLSASFISAPAALAISKLSWPDDKVKEDEQFPDTEPEELNGGIIDAATNGAVGVISVIAHIVVCLIAYVSLLACFNAIILWMGERVNLQMLTLQVICAHIFWPLVFIMGVRTEDCKIAARILGIKLNVNELVAYADLGVVIRNRAELAAYNGTWHWTGQDDIVLERTNKTLVGGVMTAHSEMITTYAICGFSDLLSYGILIACLLAVSPSRKKDIMAAVNRAICSGVTTCFLTACVVGMIGDE